MHKLCNGVSFFNNDFLRPVSQLGLKRNKIFTIQQDLPYFLHTLLTKKTVGSQFSYNLNQLKDFSDTLNTLRRLANHILLKPFKYAK